MTLKENAQGVACYYESMAEQVGPSPITVGEWAAKAYLAGAREGLAMAAEWLEKSYPLPPVVMCHLRSIADGSGE